jgi:hypothetical protein
MGSRKRHEPTLEPIPELIRKIQPRVAPFLTSGHYLRRSCDSRMTLPPALHIKRPGLVSASDGISNQRLLLLVHTGQPTSSLARSNCLVGSRANGGIGHRRMPFYPLYPQAQWLQQTHVCREARVQNQCGKRLQLRSPRIQWKPHSPAGSITPSFRARYPCVE